MSSMVRRGNSKHRKGVAALKIGQKSDSQSLKRTSCNITGFGVISKLAARHVLSMTGIDHYNDISRYNICVVPLIGVRHVVASPSADGRFAARQCALYCIDGKEGVTHVPLHVLIRVSVAVLPGHIPVERPYLGHDALGIQILILLFHHR